MMSDTKSSLPESKATVELLSSLVPPHSQFPPEITKAIEFMSQELSTKSSVSLIDSPLDHIIEVSIPSGYVEVYLPINEERSKQLGVGKHKSAQPLGDAGHWMLPAGSHTIDTRVHKPDYHPKLCEAGDIEKYEWQQVDDPVTEHMLNQKLLQRASDTINGEFGDKIIMPESEVRQAVQNAAKSAKEGLAGKDAKDAKSGTEAKLLRKMEQVAGLEKVTVGHAPKGVFDIPAIKVPKKWVPVRRRVPAPDRKNRIKLSTETAQAVFSSITLGDNMMYSLHYRPQVITFDHIPAAMANVPHHFNAMELCQDCISIILSTGVLKKHPVCESMKAFEAASLEGVRDAVLSELKKYSEKYGINFSLQVTDRVLKFDKASDPASGSSLLVNDPESKDEQTKLSLENFVLLEKKIQLRDDMRKFANEVADKKQEAIKAEQKANLDLQMKQEASRAAALRMKQETEEKEREAEEKAKYEEDRAKREKERTDAKAKRDKQLAAEALEAKEREAEEKAREEEERATKARTLLKKRQEEKELKDEQEAKEREQEEEKKREKARQKQDEEKRKKRQREDDDAKRQHEAAIEALAEKKRVLDREIEKEKKTAEERKLRQQDAEAERELQRLKEEAQLDEARWKKAQDDEIAAREKKRAKERALEEEREAERKAQEAADELKEKKMKEKKKAEEKALKDAEEAKDQEEKRLKDLEKKRKDAETAFKIKQEAEIEAIMIRAMESKAAAEREEKRLEVERSLAAEKRRREMKLIDEDKALVEETKKKEKDLQAAKEQAEQDKRNCEQRIKTAEVEHKLKLLEEEAKIKKRNLELLATEEKIRAAFVHDITKDIVDPETRGKMFMHYLFSVTPDQLYKLDLERIKTHQQVSEDFVVVDEDDQKGENAAKRGTAFIPRSVRFSGRGPSHSGMTPVTTHQPQS